VFRVKDKLLELVLARVRVPAQVPERALAQVPELAKALGQLAWPIWSCCLDRLTRS